MVHLTGCCLAGRVEVVRPRPISSPLVSALSGLGTEVPDILTVAAAELTPFWASLTADVLQVIHFDFPLLPLDARLRRHGQLPA